MSLLILTPLVAGVYGAIALLLALSLTEVLPARFFTRAGPPPAPARLREIAPLIVFSVVS